MSTMRKYAGLAVVTAAVGGIMGCEATMGLDSTTNGSLAFSVDRVSSGLLGLSTSAPNEISSGGHTIVLTSATMTASELELRGASSGSGGSAMTSKFETGPVTVNIPVEGGTTREITASIAAGTYDKFEMDVRTVRLVGTYDGSPFDVTVQVNSEMESRLVPPLVVADGAAATAVKVALDLQSWFISSTGALLDPRQAQTDTAVAAAIRSNISGSFEASEDHDREHRGGDDSADD